MGAATLDLMTDTLGGVNDLKVIVICARTDNVYKCLDLFEDLTF